MVRTRLLTKTILGVMILFSNSSLFSQDWNQWRGPDRDGKLTGFEIPESWPTELSLNWQVTIGIGDATPALVGDRLYTFTREGEDECIRCLNADDGSEIWKDQYAAEDKPMMGVQHQGTRSSPVVANGKIVTLGVGGIISCLDAGTGELLWRKNPLPGEVPMFHVAMSPILFNGSCVIHLGKGENGVITAYDLNTGDEKWSEVVAGPEYSSPVLLSIAGSKQLVTLAKKSVIGIDVSNGGLLWELPFLPERGSYNVATPIVDGQTVYLSGSGEGIKAIRIEMQGEEFVPKELWNNTEIGVEFNTPVLKDGLLFGLTKRSRLFCLNAQTGQTVWLDETRQDRGGYAAILDAGQVILALPSSSELIVIKPDDKAYTELARIKVADTPTFAHPVIRGNRIYIKDLETIAMWIIE